MEPTLEIFGSQIVVNGDLNPPVITPDWLRSNNLIGADDADYAKKNESLAITPDISRFETEWFSVQTLRKQFVLISKGPVTPALKDLAIGIFMLLEHTPINAVGLNSMAHFKIGSVADYHKVGDILAPKRIWNTFYPPGKDQNVGLQEMTMVINPCERDANVPDTARVKRITLSTSDKIKQNGLCLILNDHFPIEAEKNKKITESEILLGIIEANFQSSMDEAKKVFTGIINQAILD